MRNTFAASFAKRAIILGVKAVNAQFFVTVVLKFASATGAVFNHSYILLSFFFTFYRRVREKSNSRSKTK